MSAFKKLGLSPLQHLDSHYSEAQAQTEKTFEFKWKRRETYESEVMKNNTTRWLIERYLDNDPTRLDELLQGKGKIILDAGCGSGFSASLLFGKKLLDHHYLGIDISDAIHIAESRFKELGYPAEFFKADLFQIPISNESVDIIFSEGVLHHTDNTEKAIKVLSDKLKIGGKFLFYVYKKKAIIREFTDDYIREQLKGMTNEEAWEALQSLTKLGIELGNLNVEINISENIPFLGIQKGKTDIQRFFYWNICKLFYKSELSLAEMNHINFDWFRPLNCHRHTPEEIKRYCNKAGLKIDHLNIQDSGITVVATRCF